MMRTITTLSLATLMTACGASVQKDVENPEPATQNSHENHAHANDTEVITSVDPAVERRSNMAMATQKAVYTSRDPFVEPTLSDACGWKKPTLYFTTDSAELGLVGDIKVNSLATCLNSDALHEEKVIVVGYADERGAEYHNLELGLERANEVKEELVAQGVAAKRIETYSRGEYIVDNDDQLQDDRRALVKLDR